MWLVPRQRAAPLYWRSRSHTHTHTVIRDLLSKEERTKAVASLMFLKEKRDHSEKARMCANGQKPRGDWIKQDTTSPTMLMEAVFITAVVNAYKGYTIACFDIPGAFFAGLL